MTGRYVEVNMDETNEIMRMSCPACKYPMRVLGKHEDNIYHCYCAACQTDRYMKDTLDTEKLTFKEFDRGMKRGKGIDLEQISDLVYELYDENEQLKSICQDHRDHAMDFKADCGRLEKENDELKKENNNLKKALWEAEENYLYEAYYDNSVRREDKLQNLKEDFKRGYWND